MILFLSILLPLFAAAHPGIGIEADKKGNIYYPIYIMSGKLILRVIKPLL